MRTLPLLRATHLEPSLAVTALATALAAGVGLGWRSLLVVPAVLSGQFAVGWHNDAVDAERDRAAGRRDKPVVADGLRPALLARLVWPALAVALVSTIPFGARTMAAYAVALASALAYNAWLKPTAWSPLPWAVSFALLPACAWFAVGRTPPWWAVATGALLGSGAHFVNALPDLADDAATGVRSLPTRLGPLACLLVGAGLVGAGAVVLAAGPSVLPPAAGAGVAATLGLVAAVVGAGLTGRPRLAFRLTLVAAGALVAAFLAAA